MDAGAYSGRTAGPAGIWVNATITPFERPAELKDRAFLTEAEARTIERRAAGQRDDDGPPRPGDVGNYNQFWMDSGERVVSTLRTSLVIDPPDGRVPLRPEAEARRDDNAAHESDSFHFMSVWDRCITRGVPAGMFPAGYNNAYQIVQTPGFVVIHYEMIHEARIIPIADRPALSESVRLWNGDPRGRWEGNTLVVETTHFNDKGWIATQAAAGRIKGIPQTESLRIVERFTPIALGTIDYQVTIDDPGSTRGHGRSRCRSTATTPIRSSNTPATRETRPWSTSSAPAGRRTRSARLDKRV